LITFDTGGDTGTLTMNDPHSGDHPGAQWRIVAVAAKVVTDVKKVAGVLELREAAGKTVIRWPLS